jgi:hypothetical protein
VSALSNLARRFDALGDRVNPIVVKETRQAVRSRAVVAVLSLFIVVLLIVAMAILLFAGDVRSNATETAGWETFLAFNGILLVVCGLFIPIYVAIRAAGDRSGVAADLLFTTTIRPASVIWGKLTAGMLVAMLLFATATPFVTVSYLLRGIDLPTIAFWIGVDAFIIATATAVAVFIAVIPTGIVIRVILGLIVAGFGLMSVSQMFFAVTFFGETSVTQFSADAWYATLSGAASLLLIIGLVFTLSVACVSPNPSNRALLPRTFVTIAVVASFALLAFIAGATDEVGIGEGWFSGWLVLLLAATLIASGERRDPGPRILHSRLLQRRLTRTIGILLSSGCFAGLAWCAAMTGLLIGGLFIFEEASSLFGWVTVSGRFRSIDFAEVSIAGATAMGMAIAYNLFAIALRDGPLKRFSKGTVMTPAITMLLIAAVSIVPPIAVALLGDTRGMDAEGLSLLNPVGSLIWMDGELQTARLILTAILLVVALISVSGPLGRSIKAYHSERPGHTKPIPQTEPEPVIAEPVMPTQADPDA